MEGKNKGMGNVHKEDWLKHINSNKKNLASAATTLQRTPNEDETDGATVTYKRTEDTDKENCDQLPTAPHKGGSQPSPFPHISSLQHPHPTKASLQRHNNYS